MKLSRSQKKRILILIQAFVANASGVIFVIYGTTEFLELLGAEKMPFLLLASSLIAFVYSIFYSNLVRRFSSIKILRGALIPLIILFSVISFFDIGVTLKVISLLILANFWSAYLDNAIGGIAASSVNNVQARSFIPRLKAFSSAGEVFGAALVSYLAASKVYVLPSVGIALMAVLFVLVLFTYSQYKRDFKVDLNDIRTGLKENIKLFKYIVKESPIFKYVAFLIILLVFLTQFAEFHFLADLEVSHSEEKIASTMSSVFGVQNVAIIFMNLFVVKFLLFRLGVANLTVYFPLTVLFFLVLEIISGFQTFNIILYFLVLNVSRVTYLDVALGQFFVLSPKKMKGPIYYLVQAMAALASVFASLTLLIYSYQIEAEKVLNSSLMLMLVVMFWFVALKVRKNYKLALRSYVHGRDEHYRLLAIDLLAERAQIGSGENELRSLIIKDQFKDGVTRVKAIESLGIIGNVESIVELYTTLEEGSIKERMASIKSIQNIIKRKSILNKIPITKYKLLQDYEELLVSNIPSFLKTEIIDSLKYFQIDFVIHFLDKQLKSDDLKVKINAIKTLGYFDDRSIIIYLKDLLDSEDSKLLAATISSLWQFKGFRIVLIPKFLRLLSKKDENSIIATLDVISEIKATWEVKYILEYVESDDFEIRNAAIFAMINIGKQKYIENFIKELAEVSNKNELVKLKYLLLNYKYLSEEIKGNIVKFCENIEKKLLEDFVEGFRKVNIYFDEDILNFEQFLD